MLYNGNIYYKYYNDSTSAAVTLTEKLFFGNKVGRNI